MGCVRTRAGPHRTGLAHLNSVCGVAHATYHQCHPLEAPRTDLRATGRHTAARVRRAHRSVRESAASRRMQRSIMTGLTRPPVTPVRMCGTAHGTRHPPRSRLRSRGSAVLQSRRLFRPCCCIRLERTGMPCTNINWDARSAGRLNDLHTALAGTRALPQIHVGRRAGVAHSAHVLAKRLLASAATETHARGMAAIGRLAAQAKGPRSGMILGLKDVQSVIAVASGKGGVGKSTTAGLVGRSRHAARCTS